MAQLNHELLQSCAVQKGEAKKVVDRRALEPLSIALNDRHQWVRRCAAELLGKLGDLISVDLLINALTKKWQTLIVGYVYLLH
ncbi:HEAT repeat domain-containing protein [Microcoleus sp. herbarium14]|uniref:HEAT repeat domain-containing protein n=1 Tax=Microcoleus sp. herbarium14 TaxID=3055439 RepID=UPI002FD34FAB